MDTKITAAWMPGFEAMFPADPQLVAQEIVSIGEKATPYQILDKARDPGTELHRVFDWDDTSAAEKYRIYQARQIVCHLVIKETVIEERPPIRFFYQTKNGCGYEATKIILRNQNKYQELLQSVIRELKSIRDKHRNLTELEEIFSSIDRLT